MKAKSRFTAVNAASSHPVNIQLSSDCVAMWRILMKLLTRLSPVRDYSNRMRLTMAHVRWAAIIAGSALLTFVAMRAADGLVGHRSPFTPGVVSVIFCAVGILLLRRYGPSGPVDPHHRRTWLLPSVAASGALAALALIAAMWLNVHVRI